MVWTGQRVRKLRVKNGWDQQELARRLGRSRRTIIRWEKGDVSIPKPSQEALEALDEGRPWVDMSMLEPASFGDGKLLDVLRRLRRTLR